MLLLLLLPVFVQQLLQLVEIDVLVQLGEQLLGPRLAQLGRVLQLFEVLHESLIGLDTVPARVLGEVQVGILQQVRHLVHHVHVLVQTFVGQRLQQRVVVRFDARRFHARGARTIGDDLDLLLHRDGIVRLVLAVQRHLRVCVYVRACFLSFFPSFFFTSISTRKKKEKKRRNVRHPISGYIGFIYRVPNTVQRLTGVAVRPDQITGGGWLAVRHHVRETSSHADVVVQFLGGALGPRDDLLYLGSLTPAVLVRIQHDVVNLETDDNNEL